MAKFSGDNVHKRLANDPAYEGQEWGSALKNAFLGTDEDIRAGEFWSVSLLQLAAAHFLFSEILTESRFFRDPSGCTAVAALVTEDGRIFVVS